MEWDRHKLLWDGNGTDKYVPWTTLQIAMCNKSHTKILNLFEFPHVLTA